MPWLSLPSWNSVKNVGQSLKAPLTPLHSLNIFSEHSVNFALAFGTLLRMIEQQAGEDSTLPIEWIIFTASTVYGVSALVLFRKYWTSCQHHSAIKIDGFSTPVNSDNDNDEESGMLMQSPNSSKGFGEKSALTNAQLKLKTMTRFSGAMASGYLLWMFLRGLSNEPIGVIELCAATAYALGNAGIHHQGTKNKPYLSTDVKSDLVEISKTIIPISSSTVDERTLLDEHFSVTFKNHDITTIYSIKQLFKTNFFNYFSTAQITSHAWLFTLDLALNIFTTENNVNNPSFAMARFAGAIATIPLSLNTFAMLLEADLFPTATKDNRVALLEKITLSTLVTALTSVGMGDYGLTLQGLFTESKPTPTGEFSNWLFIPMILLIAKFIGHPVWKAVQPKVRQYGELTLPDEKYQSNNYVKNILLWSREKTESSSHTSSTHYTRANDGTPQKLSNYQPSPRGSDSD